MGEDKWLNHFNVTRLFPKQEEVYKLTEEISNI